MKKEKGFQAFFWKHSWLLLLVIMVIGVLVYEAVPEVEAASNREQVVQDFKDFMNGFAHTSFDQMRETYESFQGFITTNEGVNRDGVTFEFGDSFVAFIEAIAQVMIVLYIGMGLIKEAQRGNEITMDYWTKAFVTGAVAVVALSSIPVIMDSIYGLGNIIIQRASNILNESTTYVIGTGDVVERGLLDSMTTLPGLTDLKNVLGKDAPGFVEGSEVAAVNWYQLQQAAGALNILKYVVWFPTLIAIFLMYSSLFEIRIRKLFAPIAIAAIAHEGARGGGVRFLKKYLACYVKIAIYFVIAALGTMLTLYFYGRLGQSSIVEGMDINIIMMLMANVVAGLAMMQSSGLGDEIVGV